MKTFIQFINEEFDDIDLLSLVEYFASPDESNWKLAHLMASGLDDSKKIELLGLLVKRVMKSPPEEWSDIFMPVEVIKVTLGDNKIIVDIKEEEYDILGQYIITPILNRSEVSEEEDYTIYNKILIRSKHMCLHTGSKNSLDTEISTKIDLFNIINELSDHIFDGLWFFAEGRLL